MSFRVYRGLGTWVGWGRRRTIVNNVKCNFASRLIGYRLYLLQTNAHFYRTNHTVLPLQHRLTNCFALSKYLLNKICTLKEIILYIKFVRFKVLLMMSVKTYDLMSRDVVQCGRKMPKAEEPAAWVLIEVCVTVCEDLNFLKNKNQLDVTYCFIVLMMCSTCFGHYYAHPQKLTTIVLIITWADRFLGCCWLEVGCRQAG